ncbi:IS200/IS605 family element transposase accessory protein TnpB [Chroococcidiopsis sp. FACHB-1243]|uniref:RNA-guided endonuclease InsQ/TnpB family protein n=1 Tax=Chroococcidiopsis sp. [FACHB-1243] TaxID=2692781 RepID=UPI001785B72E|nr:RNA-guided endonuclease TnpB family protein [Chroococcidiopsis sp. [FACHB-1243]]MBD2309288.1 IS200/IS605 family element transposase accessory protein TnpB [Chroococcidiopsis sp. [FACHB-1243]]
MQRTIRIQLKPDVEATEVLSQAIEQYTWSFNAVCQLGWEKDLVSGVELHKATYYDHRALTGLPSQLVCAARVKATEALKSAKKLKKKGKTVSCPTSKRCPIRYDARSYTIWFDRCEVSILGIDGRVKLPFEVAEYYRQYLDWKHTSADLLQDRKGRWWLHVVMETETPRSITTPEVVGIDLGVTNPAVDSRGSKYGSDHWKGVEDRTFELRRRLQGKGTKSAKRHLKKLSGKQKRFRKDCDHVLSKRLVQSVSTGATLAFEDLTNIRGRAKVRKAQRRRLHSWSFAQFQAFVTYKAEAKGVKVGFTDPRYTSQKCSKCGHIERGNRPSQAEFRCKKCRYECHADYNAAVNIRENFLRAGATVNSPIVSAESLG